MAHRGRSVGAGRLLGVAVLSIAGIGSPAAVAASAASVATPGGSGGPEQVHVKVECVLDQHDGTYRAVFGYQLDGQQPLTVPNGQANFVIPRAFAGQQPTQFSPGVHHGAWTAPPVANNQKTSWRVAKVRVDAYATDTACTDPVDLPADGNGTGVAVVLLLAAAAGAAVTYRATRTAQRRHSEQSTAAASQLLGVEPVSQRRGPVEASSAADDHCGDAAGDAAGGPIGGPAGGTGTSGEDGLR